MRLLVLMHKVHPVSESRVQNHDHVDTRLCRKIMLRLVHMGFRPVDNPPRPCMSPDTGMGCATCAAVRLSWKRASGQALCQTPAHPGKRPSIPRSRKVTPCCGLGCVRLVTKNARRLIGRRRDVGMRAQPMAWLNLLANSDPCISANQSSSRIHECLRATSIAWSRSSSRHGLYKKATAPASRARARASSSACDVMKMIGICQWAATI
jgi:hypothetical protein